MLLRLQASPVNSWSLEAAAKAAEAAAAAPGDWHGVPGVCRGTPRAGSERGGGAATEAAWAGPCAHHSRDTEGTGDCSRSADTRTPPRRLQPRAALTIAPGPAPAGARANEAARPLRGADARAQTC